jgi:type II secretory pathway pseudopilin PulG
MKRISTHNGISIVEAVVGIAILSFFIITIIGSFTLFTKTAAENTQRMQAAYLLEEGMEGVRFSRDSAWNTISNLNTTKTYVLNITSSAITLPEKDVVYTGEIPLDNTVFTRTLRVRDVCRHNGTDVIDRLTPPSCSGSVYLDTDIRYIEMKVEWQNRDGSQIETVEGYFANIF